MTLKSSFYAMTLWKRTKPPACRTMWARALGRFGRNFFLRYDIECTLFGFGLISKLKWMVFRKKIYMLYLLKSIFSWIQRKCKLYQSIWWFFFREFKENPMYIGNKLFLAMFGKKFREIKWYSTLAKRIQFGRFVFEDQTNKPFKQIETWNYKRFHFIIIDATQVAWVASHVSLTAGSKDCRHPLISAIA